MSIRAIVLLAFGSWLIYYCITQFLASRTAFQILEEDAVREAEMIIWKAAYEG